MLIERPGDILLRLAIADHHRNHFVREDAVGPGRRGSLLRTHRVRFARRARDPVRRREVLGGVAHGTAPVGIRQPLEERIFQQRRRAVLDPPARATHHVRGLAHVLGAAGQDHRRLAQQQAMRTLNHGLEAGAAEPIDGHRRGLDGEASSQPDMARTVHRIARGGHRVADNDVVHTRPVEPAAVERGVGGNHAEVRRSEILEGAAEGAEPRANGGAEDDVGHLRESSGVGSEGRKS
jgi:hypothetical protein